MALFDPAYDSALFWFEPVRIDGDAAMLIVPAGAAMLPALSYNLGDSVPWRPGNRSWLLYYLRWPPRSYKRPTSFAEPLTSRLVL